MKRVVHLDLDTFFVSVERLHDKSLIGQPVIVGHDSSRGVVASCSYEARRFGVHSAMAMALAKRLCPHAIIRNGDYDQYSKFSQLVTDILEEKAPTVEKASIDEHYLDISGMDKYVQSSLLFTKELSKKIMKETSLPISFGLSCNKTVSKIATGEGKPVGQQHVDAGLEKLFLSPLSVRKIPGVGEQTHTTLVNMGISKIQTLQEMSLQRLQMVFGKNGETIWNKANGIDDSPVVPFSLQKSMSKESTFPEDSIDTKMIVGIIIAMVFELGYQLRKEKKLTGCVTLKIKYSDHQTYTHQCSLPYTSNDDDLSKKLIHLFQTNRKRQLIRLVGIKFSKLIHGHMIIDMFNDTEEHVRYLQAMDKIRTRFGERAILKAINLPNEK